MTLVERCERKRRVPLRRTSTSPPPTPRLEPLKARRCLLSTGGEYRHRRLRRPRVPCSRGAATAPALLLLLGHFRRNDNPRGSTGSSHAVSSCRRASPPRSERRRINSLTHTRTARVWCREASESGGGGGMRGERRRWRLVRLRRRLAELLRSVPLLASRPWCRTGKTGDEVESEETLSVVVAPQLLLLVTAVVPASHRGRQTSRHMLRQRMPRGTPLSADNFFPGCGLTVAFLVSVSSFIATSSA